MIPYGIVYRDNPYALQKSVEIWQKKYGVFNIPSFLKIGGISAVILFLVNFFLGLFTEGGIMTYLSSFAVMLILTFVLIYMVINNTYVKQMSVINTQKEEKQIVLYDNRLEYGTGYTRATYFYCDIIFCQEKSDILTIIADTAAIPLSIQKSCVSKGSYDEFTFLLRKYIGEKYSYAGGNK